jgi:inhibitor of KinA sporulation pathway (predicted exonuclease)
MNYKYFLSLDLEQAQPSEKIIEIGACIGNLSTGEIIDTFDRFIKIDEPLTEYISNLTGITDYKLQSEGISLIEAHRDLVAFVSKYPALAKQPVVWGNGDMRYLKQQVQQAYVGKVFDWPFGYREYDVKTLFQAYQITSGSKVQAGLSKAMAKMGLQFQGTAHTAIDDAKNTWRMFIMMLKKFKHV